jgi:uncharacterized protein YbjT (DUF2867 family)
MILVTGATGTVGTEVVKALAGRGQPFRAGYRTRPQNVPAGQEAVALDFEKPETLGPALSGVDTVFVLSSTVAPEAGVVRAAKAAGVRRIVKLSVMRSAREEFTFAKWHRAAERAVEESGLQWTFLRPNGFMQNVVNYMGATIKGQGAFYTSAPDAPIAHIDARDIGAAAARVLTEPGHEGQAYEMSGPAAVTYKEMAAVLTRVLGREIRCVGISDDDYRAGAIGAGMPEFYADALVDLGRFYRSGRAAEVTPDVRRLLGRDLIGFEKFAQDYASALK